MAVNSRLLGMYVSGKKLSLEIQIFKTILKTCFIDTASGQSMTVWAESQNNGTASCETYSHLFCDG